MAIFGVLNDAALWMGRYGISSTLNSLALDIDVDTKDSTTFGNTWKKNAAGLKGFGLQMNGFWDSTYDLAIVSDLLDTEAVVTAAAASTQGSPAFCALADTASYKLGAKVGDIFAFEAGAQGTGKLGRGILISNNGTSTSTFTSGNYQIGALSSSQAMVCNLHILGVAGTGPTLDVIIQSDDSSGFSSPTTRGTFSQQNSAGSAQIIITGPVTDDWWRGSFTIAGTTPGFGIVAAIGIAQL